MSDEEMFTTVEVGDAKPSNTGDESSSISISSGTVHIPSQDDMCPGSLGSVTDAIDNNEILSSDEYYTGCYIIDTNVFVEKPDIIDSIPEDYFVVLSAKVLEELDHLKIKKNISVAGKKRANRALKNISDSLSRKDREIIMEDSDVRLLPKDFDKHNPDNKILSVALKFVGENPILLTSDFGLQARAKAMGVESISLKEYKKINNN
jgi:rRNA-processing protein FCF1